MGTLGGIEPSLVLPGEMISGGAWVAAGWF
jgi:hypothetical protein